MAELGGDEEGDVQNSSKICTYSVKIGVKVRLEIRGVQELSFRERQAVVLKESGRSNADIARLLGISEATVATLIHRARQKNYEVVIVLPGTALGLPTEPGEESENGDDGKDEEPRPRG